MKKIIIILFSLSFVFISPASANIIFECVYEVIEGKLKETAGIDFKTSKYLPNLIKNTALGKPEATVNKIMKDYTAQARIKSAEKDYNPNSIVKDTGLALLGKIIPAAAGPITVLKAASDAAHAYTRGMLDFYKNKHMANFKTMVLDPSQTRAQLRTNYNNFIKNYVNKGESGTSVLYSERKDLEDQFYTAYLQAIGPIAKMERAEKLKQLAIQAAVKELKELHNKTNWKVSYAAFYLRRAEIKDNKANILKYLNDKNFKKKVHDKIKKKNQKAETRKKTAQAQGQKLAIPVIPPSSAKLENMGELLEMRTAAILTSVIIDNYSPYFKSYLKWALEYENSSISKKIFNDATSNINATVADLNKTCFNKPKAQCSKGYKKYFRQVENLQKTLRQKKYTMRKNLGKLKNISAKAPSAIYSDIRQNYETRYKKLHSNYGMALINCKTMPAGNMEVVSKKLKDCQNAVGGFPAVLSNLKSNVKTLEQGIDNYDDAFNNAYANYNDYYTKNSIFLNMTPYNFRTEFSEIPSSEALLSPKGYIASLPQEKKIKDMETRFKKFQVKMTVFIKELPLNKSFVKDTEPLLKTIKTIYEYTSPKEGFVHLNKDNFFNDYYNKNFKNIMELLSGSMPLLSGEIFINPETPAIILIQGKKLETKKYLITIAEHKKLLASLKKTIEKMTLLTLEKRLEKGEELIKKETTLYSAIEIKSPYVHSLNYKFKALKKFLSNLKYLTKKIPYKKILSGKNISFSKETLNEMKNDYAARIKRAEEKEREILAICKKFQKVDISNDKKDWDKAEYFIRKKRWVHSPFVLNAYKQALKDFDSKRAEEEIMRRRKKTEQREQTESSIVKKLYENFKAAYQSKSVTRLNRLISNSWQTPDGTTIDDLMENLRNNFRLYNEINCSITNLKIEPSEGAINYSRYLVTYTITIKSKIYRRNINHEEKSSVSEIVRVDRSKGTAQIESTTSGNYWYIK